MWPNITKWCVLSQQILVKKLPKLAFKQSFDYILRRWLERKEKKKIPAGIVVRYDGETAPLT